MARITTSRAGQKHTRVRVLPGIREGWQVVMDGHLKPSHFTDRYLALNYAQIWAAINRPSTVLVYATGGSLDNEWTFGGGQDSQPAER